MAIRNRAVAISRCINSEALDYLAITLLLLEGWALNLCPEAYHQSIFRRQNNNVMDRAEFTLDEAALDGFREGEPR